MNSENTGSTEIGSVAKDGVANAAVTAKAVSNRGAKAAQTLAAIDTGTTGLRAMSQAEVMKKYGRHEGDTGSPEVQVALITRRLEVLSIHFKSNEQDKHSQRGMMLLISQRKQLLQYLKNTEPNRYKTLIAALGLRK